MVNLESFSLHAVMVCRIRGDDNNSEMEWNIKITN